MKPQDSTSNSTLQKIKSIYLWIMPVLLILLGNWIKDTKALTVIEYKTQDFRFQSRAQNDQPASDELLIVSIDEESLRNFGRWPWPRSTHGDLIQLLSFSYPTVIGMDILFTEPSQYIDQDNNLAHWAKETPGVITGAMMNYDRTRDSNVHKTQFEDSWKTKPLKNIVGDISQLYGSDYFIMPFRKDNERIGLLENSHFGIVNTPPNQYDGMVRKYPMIVRINNEVFPGFATQILMQHWGLIPSDLNIVLGHYIEFKKYDGNIRVPIDENGYYRINFRNNENFITIGYSELNKRLIDLHVKGINWPENYPNPQDKILIIGQSAEGLDDLGPNPLNSISPKMLNHSNIVNNVLQQDFIRIPDPNTLLILCIFIAYASTFLLEKAPISIALGIPLIIIISYTAIAFFVFAHFSYDLPLVWPILSFGTLHAGLFTIRWTSDSISQHQIKSVFSSYISPQVMNQLLESNKNIELGGTSKPVTTMFSDIRNFTSISENMNEAQLVEHLNEYLEEMVTIINNRRGTLHKYIGDAIMAVWGDVLSEDINKEASDSVIACLEMREAMAKLNEKWESEGKTPLAIGMGVNHGTVLVGNIGAKIRKEFTVIGDPVNLASRLEGVTKVFHTDLLIGESVYELIDKKTFLTRTAGLITVKGKTQTIRVYEVICERKRTTPKELIYWAEEYELAIEAYLNRDFLTASKKLSQCKKYKPDDFCTQQYLTLSIDFMNNPPSEDWNGVITLTSK